MPELPSSLRHPSPVPCAQQSHEVEDTCASMHMQHGYNTDSAQKVNTNTSHTEGCMHMQVGKS